MVQDTKQFLLVALMTIFLSCHILSAGIGKNGNLENTLETIEEAIVKEDCATLLKFVPKEGMYFEDSPYTYSEIKALLEDRTSWLYAHLFTADDSVRHYLQTATGMVRKKTWYTRANVFILYESQNYRPMDWLRGAFLKHNGRWWFDGMFCCD